MQPLGLLKDVRLFNDDLFIPIDINARLAGFVGGATSGFILGAGNSIVANGWNLSAAFNAGVNSMVTGAITGAVIGGAVGGISAYKQGNNIWTGKAKPQFYQPVIDTEMMESIAPKVNENIHSIDNYNFELPSPNSFSKEIINNYRNTSTFPVLTLAMRHP